jgi:transcriptional regulator with XRE-family HTH domain
MSAAVVPELVSLGRAIVAARREVGLSQEALALAAGLDRSYVGGVERGQRNVSYLNMLKLAAAIGTPLALIVAAASGVGD